MKELFLCFIGLDQTHLGKIMIIIKNNRLESLGICGMKFDNSNLCKIFECLQVNSKSLRILKLNECRNKIDGSTLISFLKFCSSISVLELSDLKKSQTYHFMKKISLNFQNYITINLRMEYIFSRNYLGLLLLIYHVIMRI